MIDEPVAEEWLFRFDLWTKSREGRIEYSGLKKLGFIKGIGSKVEDAVQQSSFLSWEPFSGGHV